MAIMERRRELTMIIQVMDTVTWQKTGMMIMVMKKAVEVDLFTRTHWMTGEVIPGAHGLFSHMNLPTESSIEIEQVERHDHACQRQHRGRAEGEADQPGHVAEHWF